LKRTLPAVALVVVTIGLGGCGSSNPVPGDAVQSYLSDLAEGNYTAGCGMLADSARSALIAAKGGRHPCQVIYRHCLPSDPEALKRDQTQLLFDDVQSFISGSHARAVVRGTAVAREVRRVTLIRHGYRWFLVFPGVALQRCRYGSRARTSRSHHRSG
jgi:hypothetical protein